MSRPIVFLFSGQGSHYYHMGRALFEHQPIFKEWIQIGDALFKKLTGLSVIDELYCDTHKKSDLFTRTLITHPAIFMVEYALAQLLFENGIKPDYVVGTSLGEFIAAVIAGIFSFEIALSAVITQAQMLEEKCKPGNMLAIFQSSQYYLNNSFLHNYSELAAINYPQHIVIAGQPYNLIKIENELKAHEIPSQILAVGHGFHSSLINECASDYLYFMKQQTLRAPIIPFISSTHACQLSTIKDSHFWDIIRLPIRFQSTIKYLESRGNYVYIDIGPSGTLANFVKYNLQPNALSTIIPLLTPFSDVLTNLAKLPEQLLI